MSETAETDVALVLEGTYPFVPGGVSSWVHQILHAYPDRKFSLIHIGPRKGFYERQVYDPPENVVELQNLYCGGPGEAYSRKGKLRKRKGGSSSRVLEAIRRLHVEAEVDQKLIEDLCAGDLSEEDFLHGDASFELLRNELYPKLGNGVAFTEFFWHYRALHMPLLRLLNSEYAPSRIYHTVSAGYAGLVGVAASVRTGRPFFMTEHGIYAREREIELARASWICDARPGGRCAPRPSPLRKFWSHFFKMLSKIAYTQATRVVTLSETNRQRQLKDGADPAKTYVVPNGVDKSQYAPSPDEAQDASNAERKRGMRIGFVGRVVPIKDVITLLRAFALARQQERMEMWIIGPIDEDKEYVHRCNVLATQLGLNKDVQFMGRQPMRDIYPQLDVVVLTSISEGQPLVILEAYANSVPIIATDVGACRELIEGADEDDRRLGSAGVTTRVASPTDTAAAMVYLAKNPTLRVKMGQAGYQRIVTRYQQDDVISRYDRLYSSMGAAWQA